MALALEKNIWASFHGQAQDPSWAGPLSGAQFFELIGQLVGLLTTREPDGGSILAERLNAMGSRATTLPVLNSQRSRWARAVGWNAATHAGVGNGVAWAG